MQVTISYNVDLEEIPDEVRRLLVKAEKNLEQMHQVILSVKQMGIAVESVEKLQKLHPSLFKCDELIRDIEGIMQGYLSTKLNTMVEGELEDNEAESAD